MTTGKIRVAELFAGVGGFRLGLDGYHDPEHPEFDMPAAGPFETIWANQWEPDGSDAKQFAWRCYEARFGVGSCINEDINKVINQYEMGEREIPDFDMLVGGFPCQDYSVAKPLSRSGGIEGKKGVLWWDIYRMLHLKKPKYLLLENVDRLLKSPVKQRGRDFAIILSCLADEGYSVEWRVINAAEYGMPQKRRRTYIYGVLTDDKWDLEERVVSSGILAKAFPVLPGATRKTVVDVTPEPYEISRDFGVGKKESPFQNAGCMQGGEVFSCKVHSSYDGPQMTLADIRVPDSEVPSQFFIDEADLPKWEYQRSAKKEKRTTSEGFVYNYTEGAMAWPDPLHSPARTILTGEGGRGASRTKHAIYAENGRIRRLVPDELDQIQMFPRGWTADEVGGKKMTDGHRAFCMGNALVVGIPHAIGLQIAKEKMC
ncbi:DNA (cytosine-5-)-methyltransferase [uncultured Slackia sp.]|uniref:DNA (cytosine-5-)-methyltransferase n=1 Tax=uncultured Slackia sp. TaxID=665903 RepID=UPI0026DF22EC|nr:DNA (cytosine-5-)-methyltransferase [uncultured Slackia sp.]